MVKPSETFFSLTKNFLKNERVENCRGTSQGHKCQKWLFVGILHPIRSKKDSAQANRLLLFWLGFLRWQRKKKIRCRRGHIRLWMTVSIVGMLLFSIFILIFCHQSLARFIMSNRKVPVSIDPGELTITVKTTRKFHNTRVKDILDTWFRLSPENIFFISDTSDQAFNQSSNGHLINSKCSASHTSRALCCKMNRELDFFVQRNTKWSCHFDDDNYVNVDELMKTLRQFDHTKDWYLGKPSTRGPIKIDDMEVKSEFWFATGGAGLCLSRSVIHKLASYVQNHGFQYLGQKLQAPDDVTLGYLLEHLLNVRLTIVDKFHSHFELLDGISKKKIQSQISLSSGSYDKQHENFVNVPILFSYDQDPQRFRSLHCFLYKNDCVLYYDNYFLVK